MYRTVCVDKCEDKKSLEKNISKSMDRKVLIIVINYYQSFCPLYLYILLKESTLKNMKNTSLFYQIGSVSFPKYFSFS